MADLQTLVREQMQRGGTPTYSFDDLDRRRRRKRRNDRIAEGALGLLLFVALAALLLVGMRSDRQQPMTNTPTPTSSIGPSETTTARPYFLDLRAGDTAPLPENLFADQSPARVYVNYSVSPDGTRLAYSASFAFESTDVDVMRVGTIDGTTTRTLHVPDGRNGYLPRWSPDGRTLVFQLRDGGTSDVGNIFLEDVSTGLRTQLTHLDMSTASSWFLSARFTPDGTSVVFHQPRVPLPKWDMWSVPVTGGEPTLVLRDAAFGQYFPDGKTIAFVDSPGGDSIQIADPDGSRRTLVRANTPDGIWWPEISPDGRSIAYQDGGSIYVVRVSTGESSKVADGDNATWLDDDTLVISP
jgi:dipeptidyl aminopeptidase/acylaminoacyl peptidase